jgi:iron(III) transport system substrate-binding protein
MKPFALLFLLLAASAANAQASEPNLYSARHWAVAEKITVMFPNQGTWGTHVDIAGGGVARNAKNSANAVKFLEYLAGAEAQNYFANGNNEWPTAKGVKVDNPALQAMAPRGFKSETIHVTVTGANQPQVQQMLHRVGFK